MSEENVTQEPVKEEKSPWAVMIKGLDGSFSVHQSGFRVQVDADNWIKENIGRSETLVSMRFGSAFESRFVAKQIDL